MKAGTDPGDNRTRKRRHIFRISVLLLVVCSVTVFYRHTRKSQANNLAIVSEGLIDPLALVLMPQAGDSRSDKEIRRLQQQIRDSRNPEIGLEQLGWTFVSKARESFDPGFYTLAEQCARSIAKRNPRSEEAMLLRAHVLQNLHRFKESESLARQLTEKRGLGFDYGLLGDALMEQGKLSEAVAAYQRMINLKPDLHAYARAAHMRWLKGDLVGAIEAMQLAASAATPVDAESAAWVNTRLAFYEFQAGRLQNAERRCAFALSFQSNYAPTLLLQGKMLLAQDKFDDAVCALRTAAELNPVPEYQWALAEALRSSGRDKESSAVEAQLRQHGAAADPRTFAIFLATRGESSETAIRLAKAEYDSRHDVFTHDAIAWSLAASGSYAEAEAEMERALAEGTEDGRLFFHAAIISSHCGDSDKARRWLDKAQCLSHLLLPSERHELEILTGRQARLPVVAQMHLSTAEILTNIKSQK